VDGIAKHHSNYMFELFIRNCNLAQLPMNLQRVHDEYRLTYMSPNEYIVTTDETKCVQISSFS
jgi:hypothetical protein